MVSDLQRPTLSFSLQGGGLGGAVEFKWGVLAGDPLGIMDKKELQGPILFILLVEDVISYLFCVQRPFISMM